MRRIVHIILLIQTLALPISVKAQYYSVNFDTKTVAAMSAAFNTEAATEMYYAEQLAKIRKSYQAAEEQHRELLLPPYLRHGFHENHAKDMDGSRYDDQESSERPLLGFLSV